MSQVQDSQLVKCSSCGATNRIASEGMPPGQEPVCGRCKNPLTAQDNHPLTVTDASFSADVEQSPLPVLVDFWAAWCPPCRMIAPVVEQLAGELAGRVRVAKLNSDENPVTASRFGVRSIPTLLIMKGGKEVDRMVGAQPKAAIMARLQAVI
jgi:thioredoxin 2